MMSTLVFKGFRFKAGFVRLPFYLSSDQGNRLCFGIRAGFLPYNGHSRISSGVSVTVSMRDSVAGKPLVLSN